MAEAEEDVLLRVELPETLVETELELEVVDTELVWPSVEETETETDDELLPTAEDDVEIDEDPVLELTDVVEDTTDEDDELEDPAPGMLSGPGTYFVLS